MPFPFLFLALALGAGIVVFSFFPLSLPVQILLLMISLLCGWLFFKLGKYRLTFISILGITFFLGGAFFTLHHKDFTENTLHNLRASDYTDFIGTVAKSPGRGLENVHLYLKVHEVKMGNKKEKHKGILRVTIPYSSEFPVRPSWAVHDRLKVSAKLLPSKGHQNFYPNHQERYFEIQRIHNRAYAKSPLLVDPLKTGSPFSPRRILSIIKQKLQKKIEVHFRNAPNTLSHEGAIFEALLLGERRRIPEAITRSLQDAGLYHLFAISGAHIAIFSFLLFSLFRLIRIPTRVSYSLLIAFLLFYVLLVEGRPSVLRATIMTVAFLLGKLLWRDINLINTLSFSAFFLLIVNPSSLFAPGFQLTFIATLSIILFYPRVINKLPRLPLRISEIFALSLTAQLGVLPVVIFFFNRVTFSGLFLNLAAIPLIALIMAIGYLFLPLSLLAPFLANILAKSASSLIDVLVGMCHLHDQASLLSWRIPSSPFWIIGGYYIFLGLLLLSAKYKKQRMAASGCFLLFLLILITYPFPSYSKNLKVTIIDVGQGESILVELPGSQKMLIDGGGVPDDTFDIGENVVSPFLWRKGIQKIHYLVLTHPHPDHANGLKAVARNFKIGEFWEGFSVLEDETYARFIRTLPPKTPRKRMFKGQIRTINDVHIRFLHPPKKEPYVARVHNDFSLVMHLAYGSNSFLLTGDIGKEVEKTFVEEYGRLQSRVFKSPHHGSNSSSSWPFLKKVSPEIIVISVGLGNRYGLPSKDVLTRYSALGAKVYRTDRHGAVEITAGKQEISVRTALVPID
ncbi:MAG: DNA internalization-related competence protein ComEC/Rec2 [Candidatus Aminicenantes bacterium]|jgi:competence protein ComEC